jgi:hypothetical protein
VKAMIGLSGWPFPSYMYTAPPCTAYEVVNVDVSKFTVGAMACTTEGAYTLSMKIAPPAQSAMQSVNVVPSILRLLKELVAPMAPPRRALTLDKADPIIFKEEFSLRRTPPKHKPAQLMSSAVKSEMSILVYSDKPMTETFIGGLSFKSIG